MSQLWGQGAWGNWEDFLWDNRKSYRAETLHYAGLRQNGVGLALSDGEAVFKMVISRDDAHRLAEMLIRAAEDTASLVHEYGFEAGSEVSSEMDFYLETRGDPDLDEEV